MSFRNHSPNSFLSKDPFLFFSFLFFSFLFFSFLFFSFLFFSFLFFSFLFFSFLFFSFLFFSLVGLCPRMYWHRIAAAAAAAAAAAREGRLSPAYVQIHEAHNSFHTWDCSCEHSPGCTSTFECGGCPSMQQSGLSSYFVFMCLLYDLLSYLFHCRLCIWNQYFSFVFLGFPRHASLRDRSPESSVPYVTFNSRSSLIRTTFGVHASFFPSSHLRVSCTPRTFRVTWRILSHRYAAPRDETMCLLSPSEKNRWKAFLRSFHKNEFVRKVLIKYRLPSFPCNIRYN